MLVLEERKRVNVFDCHVHLPVRWDRRPDLSMPRPEAILHELHEVGVGRAVCFPTFEIEPDNDGLGSFARGRSDVVPFAWLNPHLPGEAAKLRRLVIDEGFMGVKLHPVLHAFAPDRPLLDPIMAAAEELRVPVLVHTGHPMHATPWQAAGLAKRWPSVAVVMEHMGLQMGWVDSAIEVAGEHPNLILGITAMPYVRKIAEAVGAVGAERVIWGSDAPGLDPASELLRVRRAGLAAMDEEMVLGGSLERLLASAGT